MFWLQKSDRKIEYTRDPWPMASIIHRRAKYLYMKNEKQNKYGLFKEDVEGNDARARGNDDRRPLMPKKTEGGRESVRRRYAYFRAQKRHESARNEKNAFRRRFRIVKGGRPTRDEDGDFVITQAYYYILHHLNVSRKNGPIEFCYVLGYLFTDWAPHTSVAVHVKTVHLFCG